MMFTKNIVSFSLKFHSAHVNFIVVFPVTLKAREAVQPFQVIWRPSLPQLYTALSVKRGAAKESGGNKVASLEP